MPLVTLKQMLNDALSNNYAICAFNVENLEMAQAVILSADNLYSPVIIQTTPSTLKYAPPEVFVGMIKSLADLVRIPVALHLDHGSNLEILKHCLTAGYTSVMIDGSLLPFEENIALSKKAVIMSGIIPVEAELGTIGGKEDSLSAGIQYANPNQVNDFVRQTSVFSLAVAIGTAHGVYKGNPKLDLNLLKKIHELVDIPLVLHGTSGVPEDLVRACIRLGISKVNYATDLRIAYTDAIRNWVSKNMNSFDPKQIGNDAKEAVVKIVSDRIRLVGSDGKA